MDTPAPEMSGLAARYAQLETQREPYLRRARAAAKLTIPSLILPSGATGQTDLPTPYQSVGARGVNNLTAKLLLTLFPPNAPFVRYEVSDLALDQIQEDPQKKEDIETALAKLENAIMVELEGMAARVSLFEALKHDIVAGNVLVCMPPKENCIRVYPIDRYVVKRAPNGTILEIIIKESVSPLALPDDLQKQITEAQNKTEADNQNGSPDKVLNLFTGIKLVKGRYQVWQEVFGMKVPKSDGWYPKNKLPWLALRWTKVDGEDYGRSYVEEYLGDLYSCEGLNQAVLEWSAAAAKVLIMVAPNGMTKVDAVRKAPNGAVISGHKDDVTVLTLDKFADFQVTSKVLDDVTQRLSMAFLLHSAIQRNGERVTAEEIRVMATDLEDALGGVYSVLSQELQLPLVKTIMGKLEKRGLVRPFKDDLAKPVIVTGLEALGRGHELVKLNTFAEGLIKIFGPEVVSRHLSVTAFASRAANAAGVEAKGLVRTEEEIQQEQAAAQQAQSQETMIKSLGPQAVKGISDAVNTNNQQQAAPQDAAAEQG